MAKGKKSAPTKGPLRLEYRKPSELADNPANWRTHPDSQMDALAEVLADVGWAGVLLFNERTGRLIDGHARKKLALKSDEPVPVVIGSWSEEQERLILATHDPLAAMAQADTAALDSLLAGVSVEGAAVNAMLDGLRAAHEAARPARTEGGGGDEFDATPAADGPTRTALGQLWVIGGTHRLLVGDSTDPANVARVMGDRTAALVLTDPPYGVDFKRGQFITDPSRPTAAARGVGDEIEGDHRKGEDQRAFIAAVFRVAQKHAAPGCPVYMFSASMAGGCHSYFGLCDAGVHVQSQLIWAKNVHALGQADYHWKHELCWYGWFPGAPHKWYGGRDKFTVLQFARDQATEHPNQKPIELLKHLIENSSREGDVLFEPFGGSGSLMVAAHRTGREVRMCEIDPRYADLILKRAGAEGLTCELETQERAAPEGRAGAGARSRRRGARATDGQRVGGSA